jgi:hypothetical protein
MQAFRNYVFPDDKKYIIYPNHLTTATKCSMITPLQETEQIRIDSLRQKDEISQSAVASPEVNQ